MKKTKSSIGSRLRMLREKKSIGIKTAAPQVNVTYSYLSKIENGHKAPTIELLEKLCEIYDADEEQIIAEFGELPPDIRSIVQENGKEVFDLLRERFGKKQKKGAGK